MKTTLLSTVMIFSAFGSIAQCNPSISASTTPITTNMNTLGSGDSWVCENLLATDNGSASTIYLEENASLNCFGCTATIYAKNGTTVNIYSNGTPTVYHVASASVNDVSGMATTTSCPSVTYDYSSAPAGGCVAGVGINDYEANLFQLYPNPSNGAITIQMSREINQGVQISILSIDGTLIRTISGQNTRIDVDLNNLSAGYYIVKLESEDGTLVSRETLVIQ